MKHLVSFFLLMALCWTATAQQTEITLGRSDYRMDNGCPVVTNDSLLRLLHSGKVGTVVWETPHNGLKVLKADPGRPYPEPTDCDGYLQIFSGTKLWFRSSKDTVFPYHQLWRTDYLFRDLKYNEGVAEMQHCTRVDDFGEYECRGEYDDGNHEFPSTALSFIYSEEGYYIPVNEDCDWKEIQLGDSVCLTIKVFRDRTGDYGEKPYAEITAIERICFGGDVDTTGRIVFQSGDTITLSPKEAQWGWETHSFFADADGQQIEFAEFWPSLHMSPGLCSKVKGNKIHFVEHYNRCNLRWGKSYVLRPSSKRAKKHKVPDCILILEEVF